jgi:hypothetical protein
MISGDESASPSGRGVRLPRPLIRDRAACNGLHRALPHSLAITQRPRPAAATISTPGTGRARAARRPHPRRFARRRSRRRAWLEAYRIEQVLAAVDAVTLALVELRSQCRKWRARTPRTFRHLVEAVRRLQHGWRQSSGTCIQGVSFGSFGVRRRQPRRLANHIVNGNTGEAAPRPHWIGRSRALGIVGRSLGLHRSVCPLARAQARRCVKAANVPRGRRQRRS